MKKISNLCKCGHKKARHDYKRKTMVPNMFSSLFFAKNYIIENHSGFCHKCNCKRFDESDIKGRLTKLT